MEIHPAIVSGVFALFLFLISLGIANLNYRIKKIEEEKVSDEILQKELELVSLKFDTMASNLEDESKHNNSAHDRLMQDSLLIHKILEEIKGCLEDLQRGQEC